MPAPSPKESATSETSDQSISQPAPTPAFQLETVLDITGSGSKSTRTFTVGNSWQINWSYDC